MQQLTSPNLSWYKWYSRGLVASKGGWQELKHSYRAVLEALAVKFIKKNYAK